MPDRRWAGVGKFAKGFLIQSFGPTKDWPAAGPEPGGLLRNGEAPAKRTEKNNDHY